MVHSEVQILAPLPSLLRQNGKQIENAKQWQENREALRDAVLQFFYGGMPPEPTVYRLEVVEDNGRGGCNLYRIHTGSEDKQITITLRLYRPDLAGKLPVLVCGDGCWQEFNDETIHAALDRGYIVAHFDRCDAANDSYHYDLPHKLFDIYPDGHFTILSAWAWAYKRVVDALYTMDFVDRAKIGITGHSRGGKTVLLAAAADERITYANPNDSGANGCGCYRVLQLEPDGTHDQRNETMADLLNAIPQWVGEELQQYNGRETEMPYDLHFVKALVAPRGLFETEALDDIWANPKGTYLTWLAAREVYALLGKKEMEGIRYRAGGHAHTKADVMAFLDFMEGKHSQEAYFTKESFHKDYTI